MSEAEIDAALIEQLNQLTAQIQARLADRRVAMQKDVARFLADNANALLDTTALGGKSAPEFIRARDRAAYALGYANGFVSGQLLNEPLFNQEQALRLVKTAAPPEDFEEQVSNAVLARATRS